jgi:hypothetical protein
VTNIAGRPRPHAPSTTPALIAFLSTSQLDDDHTVCPLELRRVDTSRGPSTRPTFPHYGSPTRSSTMPSTASSVCHELPNDMGAASRGHWRRREDWRSEEWSVSQPWAVQRHSTLDFFSTAVLHDETNSTGKLQHHQRNTNHILKVCFSLVRE